MEVISSRTYNLLISALQRNRVWFTRLIEWLHFHSDKNDVNKIRNFFEYEVAIERFHIRSNENDVNDIHNFSVMPYLCHIVEKPLRDVLILQFASFLKGKDSHHICY